MASGIVKELKRHRVSLPYHFYLRCLDLHRVATELKRSTLCDIHSPNCNLGTRADAKAGLHTGLWGDNGISTTASQLS